MGFAGSTYLTTNIHHLCLLEILQPAMMFLTLDTEFGHLAVKTYAGGGVSGSQLSTSSAVGVMGGGSQLPGLFTASTGGNGIQ